MKAYINVNQLVLIIFLISIAGGITISAAIKADKEHKRTIDVVSDDIYKLAISLKGER